MKTFLEFLAEGEVVKGKFNYHKTTEPEYLNRHLRGLGSATHDHYDREWMNHKLPHWADHKDTKFQLLRDRARFTHGKKVHDIIGGQKHFDLKGAIEGALSRLESNPKSSEESPEDKKYNKAVRKQQRDRKKQHTKRKLPTFLSFIKGGKHD